MGDYFEQLESLTKKQLMVLLARQRQDRLQGIAVSGMACRFPGDIDSPDDFSKALSAGRVVFTGQSVLPTDSRGAPRWDTTAVDLAPIAPTLESGYYLSDVDLF